ncbi:MAG: DUF6553 family protein [Wujia sp.]
MCEMNKMNGMKERTKQPDWLELFYTEMNPEKRQELLLSHVSEPKTETDLFREQMWVSRYGKRKPKTDAFVGYLMNLKYIAESGTVDIGGKKKKLAVEVIHGLHLYEIEKKSEEQQTIIFSELKHTCLKLIDISANGRGFTSVIFGMGQLSDESVAKKIAEQLSTVVYEAPHILRMDKEFVVLQRAAAEAFRAVYPNREHFLKKR